MPEKPVAGIDVSKDFSDMCIITSEEKARKTGAGEVKWKVWNTST